MYAIIIVTVLNNAAFGKNPLKEWITVKCKKVPPKIHFADLLPMVKDFESWILCGKILHTAQKMRNPLDFWRPNATLIRSYFYTIIMNNKL